MPKVYSAAQNLPRCYRCHNVAKFISERARERLSALKTIDPKDVAASVVCGVHGPGRDKRSIYGGYTRDWVPINDMESMLAVEALRLREQERLKATIRADAEHHARIRAIAVTRWREYDEEPEYVVREERDEGRGRRMWAIYSAVELTKEREYGHMSLVRISLDALGGWNDVHGPVNVRTEVSSELTPKLSIVYARTLMEAAIAAEVMNEMVQRPKHDEDVNTITT